MRPWHHVTKNEVRLSDVLKNQFRFPEEKISLLFELGAVQEKAHRFFNDCDLKRGAHLIIHPQPVRFPVATVNWRETIVANEKEFLVIHKPGGIPVHGTPDNATENVLEQLRLHTKENLLITQRLDTPVSGLMVLAKNSSFQNYFNSLLREGKVQKEYAALTLRPAPLGHHVHFLLEGKEKRKRVFPTEVPHSLRCELEVLSSEPFENFFETRIRPLTGRTHQIRAQLAALRFPIVGDSLYGYRGPRIERRSGRREIALISRSLSFKNFNFEIVPDWHK